MKIDSRTAVVDRIFAKLYPRTNGAERVGGPYKKKGPVRLAALPARFLACEMQVTKIPMCRQLLAVIQ